MGIVVSIILIAAGAILSFAVTDTINDVDLTTVGYILMGAGLLGLIVALILNSQRNNTSHTVIEDRHIHRDDI